MIVSIHRLNRPSECRPPFCQPIGRPSDVRRHRTLLLTVGVNDRAQIANSISRGNEGCFPHFTSLTFPITHYHPDHLRGSTKSKGHPKPNGQTLPQGPG